ncbi:MAG: hypothetical protein ACREP9_05410 [Candidatus Dormibacteraceae bacterium]
MGKERVREGGKVPTDLGAGKPEIRRVEVEQSAIRGRGVTLLLPPPKKLPEK